MCPNGIIVSLHGPYEGCRHDAGILRESQLYSHLEKLVGEGVFVLYGDPAYPLRPLLMKPYCGARISATQAEFNKSMSAVRQAVEWGFGKVVNEFAFIDLKKKSEAPAAGILPSAGLLSYSQMLIHVSMAARRLITSMLLLHHWKNS